LAAQITPEDVAEGEDVDFEEQKEHWNTYKLKDGTTLMLKLILIGVKRLKKWQPDGTPIYVVNSQNVMRIVNVPKELRGKVKESTFKPV
jgi:hypothetical protein